MTEIELNDLPKQFQWNSLSSERFINALSSKDIQELIQDFETQHFISYDKKVVDNVVSRFNDIIETVAKRCLQIGVRKKPRKTSRQNHAWFDKECKIFQKHVKRMSNLKHRNPHNTNIRDNYQNLTKKSKALLRTKQQCHFNDKLNLLSKLQDQTRKVFGIPSKLWKKAAIQKSITRFPLINYMTILVLASLQLKRPNRLWCYKLQYRNYLWPNY